MKNIKICVISGELPPHKNYITAADEVNENLIKLFDKLNYEVFYVFIDENKNIYQEEHPEKRNRYNFIKQKKNIHLFNLKESSSEELKFKINNIIKENNIKNIFAFTLGIDYIDKKKDLKIISWGIHDNVYPKLKILYFTKNYFKRKIKQFLFFFENFKTYISCIKNINKTLISITPAKIYERKWKKIFRNKIIFVPQTTRDYSLEVNEISEINFDKNKKNCLLIGMPNNSIASGNIKYLCETVLPTLKKNSILNKFHFYVIGSFENLNQNIKFYLDAWEENITITNHIKDLNTVMYNSDAVLQLTPFLPVAATRIYSWSSLSPLLIANKKIRVNFPELIDDHNCLLGSNSEDYLKIFKKILNENNKIIKIRSSFRELYDTKWNQKVFLNSMENIFVKYFK